MNWTGWMFLVLGYGEPPNPRSQTFMNWVYGLWVVAAILQGIRIGYEDAKKNGWRRRR